MAQVTQVEGVEAGGKVGKRCQRRGQAHVMEDDPFEMSGQARAAQQVAADDRGQAQAQGAAAVLGEQAMALHHHHVQAVVRVGQHLGVLVLQQFIQHQAAEAADLRHAHTLGEALAGVEIAQAADAGRGVREAGAGEAPGTDGGADQRAFPRCARKPVAEQRQVQALDAQGFGAACGAGQDADVGGRKTLLTDPRHGAASRAQGEGGKLDLNGAHAGLLNARERL
ncbi:hypothetical protein D3C76_1037150 [compost metagenome]